MKQVTWGLIGCGDIARKRVAAALRDTDRSALMAVSRRQTGLARAFAEEFGASKWYSTWAELVADPDLNAVYLATPVHLHAEQTIAAAAAGKHVLCEKPLALSVAECDRMIAACRANNVKLGVAYYRHFYPVINRIRKILQSDEIGKPVMAQINAFESFNPPRDHPRHWLLRKDESGGGPMFDFGCHRIEVLLHLMGPISKVRGLTANVRFEREVEDTAAALFRFEAGGCGTLAVTHSASEAQDTLDVFGAAGSVHVTVLNEGNLRVLTAHGERTEAHPPAENLHAPLIADFVEAVLNDREPAVTGEIGRAVALVEEQIYE
jgi:predicted dehydrogenase